jgi:hypothetical protein
MAAATGAGLVAFGASLLATPSHYVPAEASSADVQRLGEAVENAVARELSKVRPAAADAAAGQYASEPWELILSEEEVNAWLGSRLPQWLASRERAMPAGLSGAAVHLESGRIRLAATRQTALGGLVVTQTLRVGEGADSRLTADGLQAGIVPLPFGASWLDKWLVRVSAPIRLEDGRDIDILEIRTEQGSLLVRCRTVKRRR